MHHGHHAQAEGEKVSVTPLIPNGHGAVPEGWANYREFAATIKDQDPEVQDLAELVGGLRDAWIHWSLAIVIGYKYNYISSDYEVHYVVLTEIDENGGRKYEDRPIAKFITDWQASRRCYHEMMIINNLAEKHC